jgi:sugar phosphate isomerase/epimerase
MPADASTGLLLAGIGDEAGYGIHAQVAAARALGWSAIELRSVDGLALADLSEPAFAQVAEAVDAAGLRVVAVDSRIGGWARTADGDFAADLAELDVLTRRCRSLGTPYVRIMSYPRGGLSGPAWRTAAIDRIGALAARAASAGLVLLLENCAGWAESSADRMREVLEAVNSPALRLLFDIGNGIAYGYAAPDLLGDIVGWVDHVHVKDAKGPATAPAYCLPGEGDAGVADCLRLLLDAGYAGALSIEPHLAVVPHEGRREPDSVCAAAFVAAGRALTELLGERASERGSPDLVLGDGRPG